MPFKVDAFIQVTLLSPVDHSYLVGVPPEPEDSRLGSLTRVFIYELQIEAKIRKVRLYNENYVVYEARGPPGPHEAILLAVPVDYSRLSAWQSCMRFLRARTRGLDNDFVLLPRVNSDAENSEKHAREISRFSPT